jgi:hypothetical protein
MSALEAWAGPSESLATYSLVPLVSWVHHWMQESLGARTRA